MSVSLAEYIAQANRGATQSVLGSEYLSKAFSGTPFTVDTDTNIFTTTFGRKVWHALNNQTRFFNALPRNVWGNVAGWRVRSDRGSERSNPITETGSLPTVDISAIQTVSSLPRIVGTTFAASVKAMFTSQLEGGVGDVLALENENAQLDHIKEMNLELLAASVAGITTATSTTEIICTNANNFRVGDALGFSDAGNLENTTGSAISAKSSSTRALTLAALDSSPATADAVFTYSRAGLTSIDDIVSIDATNVLDGTNVTYANAYDLTATLAASGRTIAANPWKTAASVQANDGTGRDLSLNLLDTAIQKIRTNGGEPKLIVMGHDQYFKLERLLNSQQRYLGQEEYTVGVGSEKTFPGTRTGLILATYMGIPILPDADTTKSAKIGSTGGTHGSNVYVLDTDYLEVAVAQPTQYIENRDYFAASSLVVRGLLYTMAELRAHRFDVQAKIVDLSE
tara:strand:- start:781 stop:2145 length:1365 start_codon:yes stop_codon:yes gene_type:complete